MEQITNKKAYHDYFIEDELECGIALHGHEVKGIRNGSVSLKEAWCDIENGELIVKGMHIAKLTETFDFGIDEKRPRKLLAHKQEITKLAKSVAEKGMTIVPLKLYFKGGRCKMLIGLCKGKKLYDKRAVAKDKTVKREIERSLANR